MKESLASLLEDPPREDSDDFSSEEARRATPTSDADDLVDKIMRQVRGTKVSKFAIRKHELRRKDQHLYYRCRLVATHEPDKVLIFRIDWVQP